MRCPFCAHTETQVAETRESDEGDVVRRRRRCSGCEKRFTTYERAEIALPVVVKKDGTRADFDAKKLRASMQLALRKRPVSIEQIDAALLRIEELRRERWHDPAERHRRLVKGNRRVIAGRGRRNSP